MNDIPARLPYHYNMQQQASHMQASLSEMKKTIIKALQDFVDIEGEEGIEVHCTLPGQGSALFLYFTQICRIV
jgi:hypothetical protein